MTNNFKAVVEFEKFIPETWRTVTIKKEFNNIDDYNRFIEKEMSYTNDKGFIDEVSAMINELKEGVVDTTNEIFPDVKDKAMAFGQNLKDKVLNTGKDIINKVQEKWVSYYIDDYKEKIKGYKEDLKKSIKEVETKSALTSLNEALKELVDLKAAFEYLWKDEKVKSLQKEIDKIEQKIKEIVGD